MTTRTDIGERRYWADVARRYFEAGTGRDEEEALARFLTTDESRGPEFDEVRAVIAYCAALRACERQRQAGSGPAGRAADAPQTDTFLTEGSKADPFSGTLPRRKRLVRAAAACTAAACLAGVALLAVLGGQENLSWGRRDVCVAYIGGRRYTDPDVVMACMRSTMRDVQSDGVAADLELQLRDMFAAPDFAGHD